MSPQTIWYSPFGSYTLSRPRAKHVLTVFELELERARRSFEHHGAQLGAGVLQRKVEVSRVPEPAVGDLAFHPDVRPGRLEQAPDLGRQLRHRVDARRPGAVGSSPRASASSSNGRSKRLLIVTCAARVDDVLLRPVEAHDVAGEARALVGVDDHRLQPGFSSPAPCAPEGP